MKNKMILRCGGNPGITNNSLLLHGATFLGAKKLLDEGALLFRKTIHWRSLAVSDQTIFYHVCRDL